MSRAARHHRGRKAAPASEDGFILVAVLWLLAGLAGLAAIYMTYALNSASASFLPAERLQAEAAIRSGVALAAYQVLAAPEAMRPTHGAFEARLGPANLVVRYRSEAARIDLNAAPKALLAAVLGAVGAPPDDADKGADRILGWRGSGDAQAKAQEAASYKAAGLTYGPRLGPFDSTLELGLVMDLSPKLVAKLLPLVTVYSARPKIDVVNADPLLLSAIPGMTPELMKKLLQARADPSLNPGDLMKLLAPANPFASVEPSKALRAFIQVDLARGRRAQAEVVFAIPDRGDEPYDILFWRDDFDGPF